MWCDYCRRDDISLCGLENLSATDGAVELLRAARELASIAADETSEDYGGASLAYLDGERICRAAIAHLRAKRWRVGCDE